MSLSASIDHQSPPSIWILKTFSISAQRMVNQKSHQSRRLYDSASRSCRTPGPALTPMVPETSRAQTCPSSSRAACSAWIPWRYLGHSWGSPASVWWSASRVGCSTWGLWWRSRWRGSSRRHSPAYQQAVLSASPQALRTTLAGSRYGCLARALAPMTVSGSVVGCCGPSSCWYVLCLDL